MQQTSSLLRIYHGSHPPVYEYASDAECKDCLEP